MCLQEVFILCIFCGTDVTPHISRAVDCWMKGGRRAHTTVVEVDACFAYQFQFVFPSLQNRKTKNGLRLQRWLLFLASPNPNHHRPSSSSSSSFGHHKYVVYIFISTNSIDKWCTSEHKIKETEPSGRAGRTWNMYYNE